MRFRAKIVGAFAGEKPPLECEANNPVAAALAATQQWFQHTSFQKTGCGLGAVWLYETGAGRTFQVECIGDRP